MLTIEKVEILASLYEKAAASESWPDRLILSDQLIDDFPALFSLAREALSRKGDAERLDFVETWGIGIQLDARKFAPSFIGAARSSIDAAILATPTLDTHPEGE